MDLVVPGQCVLLEKALQTVLKGAFILGRDGERKDSEDFIPVAAVLTLQTHDAVVELPFKKLGDDGCLTGNPSAAASLGRSFLTRPLMVLPQCLVQRVEYVNEELLCILLRPLREVRVQPAKRCPELLWGHAVGVAQPHVCQQVCEGRGHLPAVPRPARDEEGAEGRSLRLSPQQSG